MAQIKSWKNNKTLLKQEDYDKLDETQREGKYSLNKIESHFTLFENMLTLAHAKSNFCYVKYSLDKEVMYIFGQKR